MVAPPTSRYTDSAMRPPHAVSCCCFEMLRSPRARGNKGSEIGRRLGPPQGAAQTAAELAPSQALLLPATETTVVAATEKVPAEKALKKEEEVGVSSLSTTESMATIPTTCSFVSENSFASPASPTGWSFVTDNYSIYTYSATPVVSYTPRRGNTREAVAADIGPESTATGTVVDSLKIEQLGEKQLRSFKVLTDAMETHQLPAAGQCETTSFQREAIIDQYRNVLEESVLECQAADEWRRADGPTYVYNQARLQSNNVPLQCTPLSSDNSNTECVAGDQPAAHEQKLDHDRYAGKRLLASMVPIYRPSHVVLDEMEVALGAGPTCMSDWIDRRSKCQITMTRWVL